MSEQGLASIDRGTGPTVLLLHGQPGTGGSWDPVVDLLTGAHRVLAPDRPGYGASSLEAVGIARNADEIERFLIERRSGPATVVGHSWGGAVAITLAAHRPRLVRRLVLVGSVGTPASVNTIDRVLAVPAIGEALTAAGFSASAAVLPVLRRALRLTSGPVTGRLATSLPDDRMFVSGEEGRRRDIRTFLVEQRALLAELPSVTELLGTLTMPTTVVTGAWDVVVPPRVAVELARAIPHSTLVRIPECGHFVARDAPEALAAIIAEDPTT